MDSAGEPSSEASASACEATSCGGGATLPSPSLPPFELSPFLEAPLDALCVLPGPVDPCLVELPVEGLLCWLCSPSTEGAASPWWGLEAVWVELVVEELVALCVLGALVESGVGGGGARGAGRARRAGRARGGTGTGRGFGARRGRRGFGAGRGRALGTERRGKLPAPPDGRGAASPRRG